MSERDYAADLERADTARAEREALARSERHYAIEAEPRDDDSTRWFTLSNCSGNCLQGRHCDCVSDIDDDEAPATSAVVHVADIVIAAMLVGFAAAVVLGLVP